MIAQRLPEGKVTVTPLANVTGPVLIALEPDGIVYEAVMLALLTIIPLVALITAPVPVVVVGRPK